MGAPLMIAAVGGTGACMVACAHLANQELLVRVSLIHNKPAVLPAGVNAKICFLARLPPAVDWGANLDDLPDAFRAQSGCDLALDLEDPLVITLRICSTPIDVLSPCRPIGRTRGPRSPPAPFSRGSGAGVSLTRHSRSGLCRKLFGGRDRLLV